MVEADELFPPKSLEALIREFVKIDKDHLPRISILTDDEISFGATCAVSAICAEELGVSAEDIREEFIKVCEMSLGRDGMNRIFINAPYTGYPEIERLRKRGIKFKARRKISKEEEEE